MKTLLRLVFLMLGLAIPFTATSTALAAPIEPVLANWAFNLNGSVYESPPGAPATKEPPTSPAPPALIPDYVDALGFDFFTGLGTIEMTIDSPGVNNIIVFFDHDIDPLLYNGDSALIDGAPAPGQSWEIDDPVIGNIYSKVVSVGALDNLNQIGPFGDVSMAMGWNFVLGAGDIASLIFSVQMQNLPGIATLNGTLPPGISLNQFFSEDGIYPISFSSMLSITEATPVPEPATMFLLCTGLVGVAGAARKKKKNQA